jgi:hypothetical protein
MEVLAHWHNIDVNLSQSACQLLLINSIFLFFVAHWLYYQWMNTCQLLNWLAIGPSLVHWHTSGSIGM